MYCNKLQHTATYFTAVRHVGAFHLWAHIAFSILCIHLSCLLSIPSLHSATHYDALHASQHTASHTDICINSGHTSLSQDLGTTLARCVFFVCRHADARGVAVCIGERERERGRERERENEGEREKERKRESEEMTERDGERERKREERENAGSYRELQ